MKLWSEETLDAMRANDVMSGGAVYIACAPTPLAVWSGHAPLSIDDVTFAGIGDRGLAQVSGGALGAQAQNLTLSLSGVDDAVLAALNETVLKDAPVVLWRLLIRRSTRAFLDAHVYARGRVDDAPLDDVVGGEAAISIVVETAARGLGRRLGRMRTDADQRLIDPDDAGLSAVSFAAAKTMYWGGRRPASAQSALPNAGFIPDVGIGL